MKKILEISKKKKVVSIFLISIIIICLIFTVYAATASGTIPGAVEIQFNDENLFNSIKEILGDAVLKAEDKKITVMKETLEEVNGLGLQEKEISDITGLEDFTNVSLIELQDNDISDITSLKDNETIEVLNLNNNELDSIDIQVIKTMTNLKRLGMGGNNITSISELSDLASLPNLVELAIFDSNLTNLDGIEKFTNLEILYIDSNQIEDYSKLNELSNLKVLGISENNLTNINMVENLTNLEELQAYNNKIEDISILNNNTNIKSLNLNGNNLNNEDIEVLKTMQNLEELGISNNEQINQVSQIEGLTNLKGLTLSNSKIKDVSGIEKLTNLEYLEMNENEIDDIEKICQLSNLKELSLVNNKISNISPISNLTNITDLDLSLNEIAQIPNMDKISSIQNVSLKGQLLNVQVVGETGDEKTVDIPQIFKDSLNSTNDDFYGEVLNVGGELDKENKTFKADIATVAREKGMGLEIYGGILDGSKFVVNGTSVEYLQDLTNDFKEVQDLDINSDGQINSADSELLKQFCAEHLGIDQNTEITEQQQVKITKLDLNRDGNIDDKDYEIFNNYIQGKSSILVTIPVYGEPVNTDIIAKVITTDDNLEIDKQKTFTENGEYTFNYIDSKGQNQSLLANVNFIDKVAPTYQEPVYSTKEQTTGNVTVTITANEDLSDIYSPVEDSADDNTEEYTEETEDGDNIVIVDSMVEEDDEIEEWEDMGWRLAEDKRTISKTYIQNTQEAESVYLIDEAGNSTTVEINVNNIIQSDDSDALSTNLIMKKQNSEGAEYISGVWTNEDIYVNIENKEDVQSAQYSIDGEGQYTEAMTITEEGEHEIKLLIKDGFGNTYQQTYYVEIDKTSPEVGNILLKQNNNEGKILENNSITNQNVYINLEKDLYGQDEQSGHYKTVYTVNGGEERSISSIIRENGNYEIIVTTYDLAGNSASQTYNFTINR